MRGELQLSQKIHTGIGEVFMSVAKTVLVIGAGISGLISAIRAKKLGNDVTLIFNGGGATSLSLGVVDVLGYIEGREVGSPIEGIKELKNKKPKHVYSLIGIDNIEKGIEFFKKVTKDCGLKYLGDLRRNIHIATQFGTIKPTCLATEDVYNARVELWEENKISIAGNRMRDFCPEFITSSLSYLLPKIGIKAEFTNEREADIVLRPLSQKTEDSKVIPLMGDGELLRKKLMEHAEKMGIEFIKDKIKGANIKGNEVMYVSGRENYEADFFILATGDWIGGGLKTFEERIFGLDVKIPKRRLVKKIPFPERGHEYSKIGVLYNENLNPLINGTEIMNLKVCGSILANYDYCAEKSGFGVCITTGYVAGSI